MFAASIWSLIIPSINMSENLEKFSWIPATVGLILGCIFFIYMEQILPKIENKFLKKNNNKHNSTRENFMLIFAINNRFLNGNEVGTIQSIEKFFEDFWNIIKACTKKITKMIMDALIDMVIGQIKPIIDLAIRKLLLESIMYYRILLQQVLAACAINPSITLNPLFKYGQIMIDNVDYADIIPTETTPRR